MKKWIFAAVVVILIAAFGRERKDSSGTNENSYAIHKPGKERETMTVTHYRNNYSVLNVAGSGGRIVR
jgi:hypothetical protein